MTTIPPFCTVLLMDVRTNRVWIMNWRFTELHCCSSPVNSPCRCTRSAWQPHRAPSKQTMQIRTHFQSITACLRDLFHARESVGYVSVLLCVTSNEPQPMWICLLTAVVMGRSKFNGWNRYLQSYHNWSPACQNLTLSALSITTVFPELAWLKSGLRCLFGKWMIASCRLQRI